MESRRNTFSVLPRVDLPICEPNKAFSIRNILDLPEESAEECVPSSANISPAESCPVPLPLAPQVVRPMVHRYGAANVPPSGVMNWHDFGLTPYAPHWSYEAPSFRDKRCLLRMFTKKRRRPMRKKKKRPLFSPLQIQTMEKEFAKQRYVTEDKRARLALEINLTETQVKTWFQNRRTRWKKETNDEASTATRRSQEQGTNHFCQNICVDSTVYPFRSLPQYYAAPMFSIQFRL